MPPCRPAIAALVTCWLVLAPATAGAAVTAGELGGLVDRSVDGLLGRQLGWGGFDDPLAGPRFNYGAVGLAWVAGERAAPGPAGDAQRAAAAVSLRAGTRVQAPGAFQVWLEALALSQPHGAWLDEGTRAALAEHLRKYADPIVGVRAQRCKAEARCYNNLKLVDALASLQLVRTGLRSSHARSRLADPPATERAARAFLTHRVPAAQHADLSLATGRRRVVDAAVLSDPSNNPLAYHALSSALLVRALRLLGPAATTSARRAARRALWALIALADPRGTVAWMGRGQEHTWTYAASTYAALAGAAAFADDRALAARLRRLAELAFTELLARSGPTGLAVVPGAPRVTLAGADKTQDTIACNGLSLAFLHLAAAEAGAAAGPSSPLPAEVPGSTTLDPTAAGVAAVRGARTWLAVHRAATHRRAARYDAGLLAAQVLLRGRWRAVVGQRPNTDASRRAPASGPLLVRDGLTLAPAGRLAVARGAITLRGGWQGAGVRVPATWRFTATARSAALRSPCPRGHRLRLVEWTPAPAEAAVRIHARGLVLRDRTLTLSAPVRAKRLAGLRASAAHERLVGVQLDVRCSGRALTAEWRVRGSRTGSRR